MHHVQCNQPCGYEICAKLSVTQVHQPFTRKVSGMTVGRSHGSSKQVTSK